MGGSEEEGWGAHCRRPCLPHKTEPRQHLGMSQDSTARSTGTIQWRAHWGGLTDAVEVLVRRSILNERLGAGIARLVVGLLHGRRHDRLLDHTHQPSDPGPGANAGNAKRHFRSPQVSAGRSRTASPSCGWARRTHARAAQTRPSWSTPRTSSLRRGSVGCPQNPRSS